MTIETTIRAILDAESWSQRIQQIRLVPQRHGTGEHGAIYAAVARTLYMPHLAPDFAYIHESPFYETPHFFEAYDVATRLTDGFTRVGENDLMEVLIECPRTLLVFRTLLGLTKDEFAHSTLLAGGPAKLKPLSPSRVDSMERSAVLATSRPTTATALARATSQARVAAKTIVAAMDGELFGDSPPGLRSKQQKPDTESGWDSVRNYATAGVTSIQPPSRGIHQAGRHSVDCSPRWDWLGADQRCVGPRRPRYGRTRLHARYSEFDAGSCAVPGAARHSCLTISP